MLIGFPLITGLIWYWSDTSYRQLMTYKVSSDLVTAHEYMDRVVGSVGHSVEALADGDRLRRALRRGDPVQISEELNHSRRRHGLDFMYVLDAEGRVRHASAAQNSARRNDHWPVVREALAGKAGSVIDLYDAAALEAIDPSLAERAAVNIVPTAQAAPDARTTESRGMLIHAAAPILDDGGRTVGVLEGGTLPKLTETYDTNFVNNPTNVEFDSAMKIEPLTPGVNFYPDESPSLITPITYGDYEMTPADVLGQ